VSDEGNPDLKRGDRVRIVRKPGLVDDPIMEDGKEAIVYDVAFRRPKGKRPGWWATVRVDPLPPGIAKCEIDLHTNLLALVT
jgi:hypothetical protein